MSVGTTDIPPTLREKSTWTPKHNKIANQKIFQERLDLIKKWYSVWSVNQRWQLAEFVLSNLSDDDILFLYSLIHPLLPSPPPPTVDIREDFTRILPRHLSLKILSYLDPRSLCRASQVSWYWHYLSQHNQLWKPKCLRHGWFLPSPPSLADPNSIWKRHYLKCVQNMFWKPPQPHLLSQPPLSPPSHTSPPNNKSLPLNESMIRKPKMTLKQQSHAHHCEVIVQPPWKHSNKFPKDLQKTSLFVSDDKSLLFTRKPNIKSQPGHSISSLQQTTPLNHTPSSTTLSNDTQIRTENYSNESSESVPIEAMLHPSLLEKLRLGDPNDDNVSISTKNISLAGKDLADIISRVQTTSPFPKLLPYYVLSKVSVKEEEGKENRGNGEMEKDKKENGGEGDMKKEKEENGEEDESEEEEEENSEEDEMEEEEGVIDKMGEDNNTNEEKNLRHSKSFQKQVYLNQHTDIHVQEKVSITRQPDTLIRNREDLKNRSDNEELKSDVLVRDWREDDFQDSDTESDIF